MSVINGFIILLMFFLLLYIFYRLFKRKSILMLLPICAGAYALSMAILSFINNVEVPQMLQGVYILLGILPPVIFLINDYIRMVKKVKNQGVFEGLVEQPAVTVRIEPCLPPEGINELAKGKQISEVMKELKSLPDEMQKNLRKCLNHTNILLGEEDYKGLYYIYDTLSKAAGSSYMLYYNLAGICYKLKMYEKALESYKEALVLSGGDAAAFRQHDIYYNRGNTYYMLNRYEKAARSYEKALEISPDNTKTIENLAFTYVRMGERDTGIDLLRKTTIDESNYRAHFIAGRLLHEAGKYAEAEEELKKSIRLQPNTIEARDELGRVLMKQNKDEAALKVYEDISTLNPNDYTSWSHMASICSKLGRWKEAASCYKEALRIRPDSHKNYYNMAIAHEEYGNRQAAVAAFKSAIKICPDFIEAYNNLGITLSLSGRHEEALEVYEEGLRRNPQDFSLFFNMGMSLFESGKYMEAAAAYRNALDIRPQELEIYYYLGAALTEMRHFKDAIAAYKCALNIKPTDGELHYNIAAIYAILGRYDIAGENLKQAIKLNGDVRNDAINNRAFDGMRGRSDFKEMVS